VTLFTIIGDTFYKNWRYFLQGRGGATPSTSGRTRTRGTQGKKKLHSYTRNLERYQERQSNHRFFLTRIWEENLFLYPHSFIFTTLGDSVTGFILGQVFYESSTSVPLLILLAPVQFFSKTRKNIPNSSCTTGVNDTGGKQGKLLNIKFLWVATADKNIKHDANDSWKKSWSQKRTLI
jgi:hypothetical protein